MNNNFEWSLIFHGLYSFFSAQQCSNSRKTPLTYSTHRNNPRFAPGLFANLRYMKERQKKDPKVLFVVNFNFEFYSMPVFMKEVSMSWALA